MKHRLKGLLALVLSLVMVFATATSAWAAVRIGNVYMGDGTDPAYYKNGDTDTATGTESDYNAMLWLDGENLTLTLRNFTLEDGANDSAISSSQGLTLNLIGESEVTASYAGVSGGTTAIDINGDLTIEGTGSLTASGTDKGISVNSITISGGDVTVTGNNYGIYGYESVSITGGKVNANATASDNSFGICTINGFITIGGESNPAVTVGCATGLSASTVNILESSIVKINAGTTAIISDTLNMGGNWYQWTDKEDGPYNKSTDDPLNKETAAATGTLIIEKIVQPPATYTVTFDANGHGTAPATQTDIPKGGIVNKPADPTEDGWTFGGWYKEAECTNKWDFAADTVEEDITLYAKWTENSSGGDSEQEPSHKYPIRIPNPDLKPDDTVESPKTFDSGVALHIGMTILSATGGAWLAKKKD